MKVVESTVKATLGKDVIYPEPTPSNRANFPMQTLPVLSGGGGLMWVGCYGPMSTWLECAVKGLELQDKYDLTRSCYTRVMNEGHFVGLRWMLPYDKDDPVMVGRIRTDFPSILQGLFNGCGRFRNLFQEIVGIVLTIDIS